MSGIPEMPKASLPACQKSLHRTTFTKQEHLKFLTVLCIKPVFKNLYLQCCGGGDLLVHPKVLQQRPLQE